MRNLLIPSLLAAACAAHAGLVGSTVQADVRNPDRTTVTYDGGNAVVSGSLFEYPDFDGAFVLDVGDNFLTLYPKRASLFPTAGFDGFTLAGISGDRILLAQYIGGPLPKSILVEGGRLYVDLSGVAFGGSSNALSLYLQTVPEPSALAALGLGAVGLLRRRKKD